MSVDWKNRKTITLLCTAVLLFGATAAGGIYLKSLDREPVLMEDFTGKDSETVRTWAEEHRIAEDRLEFNLFYDEEIEENLIIDQNIEPGTTLKKNDLLIFSVSNGKDPGQVFTLPDFTGMTQEEISEWFDRNGFLNVSYVYEDSKDVPKNGFIAVENEQTEYRRSDEISVVISLGEGETTVTEVTVPDFSSYTRTNIQAWASTNRITVYFRTALSDTVAKDKMISQSVKPGTKVNSGTSITVTYSSGKAITVSGFAGKPRTEAAAWISASGLKAVYNEQYSANTAAGSIISQNPASGTLAEGDTVTFVVSIGYVTVNDYTGKTLDSFQAYINSLNATYGGSAGLKVNVTSQESQDVSPGSIISQDPSGSVAPGSVISVVTAAPKMTAIENRAGTTLDDFLSYLNKNGMKQGAETKQYSDTVPAGNIVSNTTGSFAQGTSIAYILSIGPYAPDSALYAAGASFTNLQNAVNTANRSGAGWTVNASYAESDTYDNGVIISSSVSGKTVNCTVSSGKVAEVPNVVGRSVADATAALQAAGFSVSAKSAGYDNNREANIVFAQSVAAGAKKAPGTQIIITYSDGPQPVTKAKLPYFYLGLYPCEPQPSQGV